MSQILVRTYDPHEREVPQPSGPVAIDVPEDAAAEQIEQTIRRQWVNPNRPATVEWRDGGGALPVNRGWAVRYED